MSIGAVSGAVARGGGGAHGSVDLPRGIQDLVTGRAGTVPAVVGGTACAPESPRQPRAHSAERPILAAGTRGHRPFSRMNRRPRTATPWKNFSSVPASSPDSPLSWFRRMLEKLRECPEVGVGDHEVI